MRTAARSSPSSMATPIICFGQQPCGFFPRRFLFAKIATARRLQQEIGGRIVFFYHDSDHDPRETVTIVRDREGVVHHLNFQFANKTQKRFSPLFAKRVLPEWKERMARQLPKFAPGPCVEIFKTVDAGDAASFCLRMYERLGLLDGVLVMRSGDPRFRANAINVPDYFVDVQYEGELVRARADGERLFLHKGGDAYIELPMTEATPAQISPARDTRFRWMQSVIGCTHYVTGAGEMRYLNRDESPDVEFVTRDEISESNHAYVPHA